MHAVMADGSLFYTVGPKRAKTQKLQTAVTTNMATSLQATNSRFTLTIV